MASLATVSGALAEGWLPPVDASPAGSYATADVAVDAAGTAVAVWSRHVDGAEWAVTSATRARGGGWSAPVDLTPDGEQAWVPQVAVDRSGDAVAVWTNWSPELATMMVRAATRPAGGGWSAPVDLSADGGWSYSPQVAIDEDGNATAVWSQTVSGEYVVRSASHPADGNWSETVDVSDDSSETDTLPQVAIAPDGEATAVWTTTASGRDDAIVQSKSRKAGEAWSAAAADLSNVAENANGAQVAVDPQGDVTAVWAVDDGGEFAVEAAQRTAGGGWSAPVELSDDRAESVYPQVALAVDPHGAATAVWSSYGPGGYLLRSSSRAAAGAWNPPADLTLPDGSDFPWAAPNPRLAVDPDGNATATWKTSVGPATFPSGPTAARLRAARRSAGAAWGAAVELSSGGDLWAAELAVDPEGAVTAIWNQPMGSYDEIRSRVFDAVAPELRDVTVPASGVVGQSVAMSADPFDVWSPVTVRWGFGDGAAGAGAAVRHCFSTPGQRIVTVTGTDGAANAASATRTIAIAHDPAHDPAADPCGDGPGPGPDPDPRPDPGPGTGPGTRPGPVTAPATEPGIRSTAPFASGLRQSSSRWRTRASDRRPRWPVGTVFRFRLDRTAQVRLAFWQVASGRRVGTRCVTAAKTNRGKPRCTGEQSRGSLSVHGRAGANAYAFRGRVDGRTLPPGMYRLRLVALADGRSSAPLTIGFTIVR